MDIRNLGNFANIEAVWVAYPNGGIEGDYLFIPNQQGTKYRWNKYIKQWENAAVVTETTGRQDFTVSDLQVQNEVHVGSHADVHGDLRVQGVLRARHVKQPNVGLFATLAALQAAYPTPEVGMWAVIGDAVPGYVYRCNTAGTWEATGETGGVDELENVVLYSEQELTEAEKKQARANLGMGNGDFATGSDFDVPDSTKRAKVVTVGAVLDGADAEPTAGSENLVKSGGVYEAVNECIEELQGIGENIVEQNRENIESALNEFAPVQITGDVTNAADEEDITSIEVGGTNVLKFKNRTYNPLTYNGKGKVILRKNIKEINGVTNNWLEQSMMTQENTIYIIQYDYDLNEQTITVPVNSILLFEGGSLSNGIIAGQNTEIKGCQGCLDIMLSGTFNGVFESSWIKFDQVSSTKNYENVATLINNYKNKVRWCNETILCTITDTEIHLIPGIDYNFDGLTLDCTNNNSQRNLFSLVSEPLSSEASTIEDLAADEIFNMARGLIFAYDPTPLYKRSGDHDYNYFRHDVFLVENNIVLGSPCLPYDAETQLELSYIILNYNSTQVRNLNVIRRGDADLRVLYAVYQYNLIVDNLCVDTLVNFDEMDGAFSIDNVHTLIFNNITINKGYRDTRGANYIFELYWITNLLCNNIKAAYSTWGCFGTRGINGAHIQNSTINRFDIHCYGKNILATNCIFVNNFNQCQCTTGYITFRNCSFIDHRGLMIYDTPVGVPCKVTYEDCDIELKSDSGHLLLFRIRESSNINARLFNNFYLPDLNVVNCKVSYVEKPSTWNSLYMISRASSSITPPLVDNTVNISVDGLTLVFGNCYNYIIDSTYSDPCEAVLCLKNVTVQDLPTPCYYSNTFLPHNSSKFNEKVTISADNSILFVNSDLSTKNINATNCTMIFESYLAHRQKWVSVANIINSVLWFVPNSENHRVVFKDGIFDRCTFRIQKDSDGVEYEYRFDTGGRVSIRYCTFLDSKWSDAVVTAAAKCHFARIPAVEYFADPSSYKPCANVIDSININSDDITALTSERLITSGTFYINNEWKYYIKGTETTLRDFVSSIYSNDLNKLFTNNSTNIEGKQLYYRGGKKLLIGDGTNWKNALGFSGLAASTGTTSERNTMIAAATLAFVPTDIGFQFFDTTLGKPVYLNVTGTGTELDPYVYSWVDSNGSDPDAQASV